ncbi:uncharacterized protein LOC116301332 isoform X2 [Actinia tenebrosa]|nr:uncharacterized protein LOC116301332 isoform X2 [Actinia tenebrosa]
MVEPKLPVKYPRTPGYRPTKQENPLNAWHWKCDIQGTRSGLLDGKTVAIKDNIPVAGVPMMIGSRILEDFVPDIDATVVTRVLDAGGRILGKATCEEFCYSDGSLTACTGPVLNPHQSSMNVCRPVMAGGSSSGCAALIAAGEVDMAIGGDQGGSIRTPAAACGIVGLKPTFGLVPYTGIASIDFTIDHVGPMAKDVWNTALLLEVITGRDEDMDPRQPCNLTVPPYTKLLTGDIKGMRIGLVKEGFESPSMEETISQSVKGAVELLRREAGAKVEEVSIPWHSIGGKIGSTMFLEYAGTSLLDGSTFTSSSYNDTNLQQAIARGLKTQPNHLSRNLKFCLLISRYMKDTCNGVLYSRAQNLRRELTKAYDEALKSFDVLIMPTCPKTVIQFPDKDAPFKEYMDSCLIPHPNTSQFDVTGHPALSINAPSPNTSTGYPIGMMIVGKKFDEVSVLNVAYVYEKLRESQKGTSQN